MSPRFPHCVTLCNYQVSYSSTELDLQVQFCLPIPFWASKAHRLKKQNRFGPLTCSDLNNAGRQKTFMMMKVWIPLGAFGFPSHKNPEAQVAEQSQRVIELSSASFFASCIHVQNPSPSSPHARLGPHQSSKPPIAIQATQYMLNLPRTLSCLLGLTHWAMRSRWWCLAVSWVWGRQATTSDTLRCDYQRRSPIIQRESAWHRKCMSPSMPQACPCWLAPVFYGFRSASFASFCIKWNNCSPSCQRQACRACLWGRKRKTKRAKAVRCSRTKRSHNSNSM